MSLHLSDLNHEIRDPEDAVRGHFRQEITRGQNRGEKTALGIFLNIFVDYPDSVTVKRVKR